MLGSYSGKAWPSCQYLVHGALAQVPFRTGAGDLKREAGICLGASTTGLKGVANIFRVR